MDTLWATLVHYGPILAGQLPYAAGLAVLFTGLSLFQSQACNPGRPWWRSRDLLTDVQHFILTPIVGPYLRMVIVLMFAAVLRGAMSESELEAYIKNGSGPVGTLPLWAQAVFYVFGTDFLLYWIHRTFHKHMLWPFHAVHHSSEDVDWTTAYRTHPINQMCGFGFVVTLMIVLGVSPAIMVALIPFDIISAAFVHANLNWTLGPLKHVIATPVFHRWHHTAPDEGGECNFASTFSIWDKLFGTFYMPEGQLPQAYGVDDPLFPKDWFGQMIVPFKQFAQRIQEPPRKQA